MLLNETSRKMCSYVTIEMLKIQIFINNNRLNYYTMSTPCIQLAPVTLNMYINIAMSIPEIKLRTGDDYYEEEKQQTNP